MSIDERLIHRLTVETGERLLGRARDGRVKALQSIRAFVVTLTRDGARSREEIFDEPPTVGQIAARAGNEVFVVSVKLQNRARSARLVEVIAAE
ncbi:MAG: hypothetical protein ORN49_01705 [Rhodobacteraceae bacterium]|nr:hypothetical protein [Paracoccaceae bacterium]